MRMANKLPILLLHLIPSVRGQKVEAQPADRFRRVRSQGGPAMDRREGACLPSSMGLPLGRSRGRETPSLSKSVLSASLRTGPAVVYAVMRGSRHEGCIETVETQWFHPVGRCRGRLVCTAARRAIDDEPLSSRLL